MTHTKQDGSNLQNAANLFDYQLDDINFLKPYAQNAKKHPQKQVHQIKASIEQFKFITPIIVDRDYNIIAGHGRYEAAKLLGLKQVPVIFVDHLSEEEKRAYRLADNQLTLNSGYDDKLLRIEITELIALDLDFDLEITGFETEELDIIIDDGQVSENDPADQIPELSPKLVTKSGDVFQLGIHRLACGDALKEDTYKQLLPNEIVDMCLTDPPYNVKINGHVSGKGKIKHDEFAMACGEMSDDEFQQFLAAVIALMITYSRSGSLHYIFMDWRGIGHLLKAGGPHYRELKNICVWNKDNAGMGSLYRSKHELVAVFKHGAKPHTNNIQLGKYGRYRTNVWDYRGVNSFKGRQDLKLHPTVKPVAMLVDAIKDCTRRGEIVLDPFAGSGSTLIACEKSGRIARCIELEPKYCDVTIRRWQALTKRDAVHAETGRTFNEIQAQGGTK